MRPKGNFTYGALAFFLVWIGGGQWLSADELTVDAGVPVKSGFQAMTLQTAEGSVLRLRFLAPDKVDVARPLPLIVHLHGAGSRGEDNQKQLGLIRPLQRYLAAKKQRCFIFAPQCPTGRKWVTTDWTKTAHTMAEAPNTQMAMALQAINLLVARYPIDQKRIYVYGQSMGGFGTWEMLSRRPNLFAAAIPVCGGGDVSQAPHLASVPLWVFHGRLDPVVPVQCSRSLVRAVVAQGGSLRYTEYPQVKHNAWSHCYTSELFDWLFSQQKEGKKDAQ